MFNLPGPNLRKPVLIAGFKREEPGIDFPGSFAGRGGLCHNPSWVLWVLCVPYVP